MVRTLVPSKKIFSIRKVKNQNKWNKEEDNQLIKLAQQYNEKNWRMVSSQFQNKNPLQCFSRYKRIRPGIKKGTWKKDEDDKIIELVNKYGTSWSKISKEIQFRKGKQIRDRYLNVLDPKINKHKFSHAEDQLLLRLFHEYGSKWAVIAKHFPHRTADMIKNRFHSSIKKKLEDEISKSIESSPLSTNTKTVPEICSPFSLHSTGDNDSVNESLHQLSDEFEEKKEQMTNTLFDINYFDIDCTINTYNNFEFVNEDNSINIMSEHEY